MSFGILVGLLRLKSACNMKTTALLLSRLFLFAFFQGLIALVLSSWVASEKYWILGATLTNIVSIVLLIVTLKREGRKYPSLFQFNKDRWKKDALLFLGLALITVPMVLLPSYYLNILIYGGSDHYADIMFQDISKPLAYFLLIAFPVTIAFAELPTYFGYLLPRIRERYPSKALAVLIPAFFLSIQHCTLPLVFERDFILYRGLVYLPFAITIGVAIHKRPSLLAYFAVFHGLLDAMTVVMLLDATKS